MHQHPMFQLTGTPVTGWIVQDRLGAQLRDDQSFLSVDYEDATNGMYSWCSKAAVDGIAAAIGLDSYDHELFERSLIHHLIAAPKGVRPAGQRLPQLRGQLMGSITSFIVLCVVNAAILRSVKEMDENRPMSLVECGALVNGDDGLLRCTRQGKLAWETISAFCGLKPSVGKVYFSPEFCNINSVNFCYDPVGTVTKVERINGGGFVQRHQHFRETKFLRLSLLYGLQRSSGAQGSGTGLSSLGAQAHELLDSCPSKMRERVLHSWLANHWDEVSSTRLPWFVPEALGGLGLPIVDSNPRYQPSEIDLRVARKVRDHPGQFPMPPRPPVGAWHVWKVAQKFAARLGLPRNEIQKQYTHDLIESAVDRRRWKPVTDMQAMRHLVVDAFLSAGSVNCLADELMLNMTPEDLAASQQETLMSYYHQVADVLAKALKDRTIPLPEPINLAHERTREPKDYWVGVSDSGEIPVRLDNIVLHDQRSDDPWSLDSATRVSFGLRDEQLW